MSEDPGDATEHMPDELRQRYAALSHDDLLGMLMRLSDAFHKESLLAQ